VDLLRQAVLEWGVAVELDPSIESVSVDEAESFHRGAGCMILKGCARNGILLWIFVVACPEWYFGNTPELTCMLPAEASSVLRDLEMPHVSPDAAMGNSCDDDGSKRINLALTTGKLCGSDRLQMVIKNLEAACADWDEAAECIHDSVSSAGATKLREACKGVLHRHGLALRHAGRVWNHMLLCG